MKPEEQRRAIAEACGWKHVPEHDVSFSTPAGRVYPECWRLETDDEVIASCADGLPAYTTDLNAMHEAELWLMKHDWDLYRDVYVRDHLAAYGAWDLPSCTAAQRAEAFLRTLNLWKE